MTWRWLPVVIGAAMCGSPDAESVAVEQQSVPLDSGAYDVVASGLQVPWALAFAPDGRIFVTERPGRVRVIRNGWLRVVSRGTYMVVKRRAPSRIGMRTSSFS